MRLSVLIPWRSDDPDRIRAWEFNRARWQALDVELCVADDGRTGRFSVPMAVNRARALASGDGLLLFGADHIPPSPEKLEWVRARLEAMPWSGVYAETRAFSRRATQKIIDGRPPETLHTQSQLICVAEGVVAVRADVWDDVGGEDERFQGWGAEDSALRFALKTLYPEGTLAGEGTLYALFHPPQPWDQLTAANNQLFVEYQLAGAAGRLREFLKGARHG
ncbi:MAG TPA: hypothetical protein VF223_04765 [Trebonia sp.]